MPRYVEAVKGLWPVGSEVAVLGSATAAFLLESRKGSLLQSSSGVFPFEWLLVVVTEEEIETIEVLQPLSMGLLAENWCRFATFDTEKWRLITILNGSYDHTTEYRDLFADSCGSIGNFIDIKKNEDGTLAIPEIMTRYHWRSTVDVTHLNLTDLERRMIGLGDPIHGACNRWVVNIHSYPDRVASARPKTPSPKRPPMSSSKRPRRA